MSAGPVLAWSGAMIDLRSDTVTKPTPAMLRAIAAAEVGDDGLGDDPTVRRLEDRVAELVGQEAAIFVPSGTMGNLLGLLVSTGPGVEVIVDADSHVVVAEGAGAAAIGGAQLRMISTADGILTAEAVVQAIRTEGSGRPRTGLLWIENTHNRHGGRVWPLSALDESMAVAKKAGLRVHVDGARLFNAAAALAVPPARLARGADTVTVCMSKGLGCPAGSVLAGRNTDIRVAREWRRRLGGTMRQTGLLAAAGLYALDHHLSRLLEDHLTARTLAAGLAGIPGLHCDVSPETNIVVVETDATVSAESLVETCRSNGLLIGIRDDGRLRFVTHLGISTTDVQIALDTVRDAARAEVKCPSTLVIRQQRKAHTSRDSR